MYNKNSEALKESKPSLYQGMLDAAFQDAESQLEKVETVSARDGNPITVVTFHGKPIRLNSSFCPTEEARKWAKQFSFPNMNNNVILYGFGNGYFVNSLLDRLPENDYLIIYEPSSEMFLHAIHNYDLESILKNPRVLISVEGLNSDEFHMQLDKVLDISNLANSTVTIHTGYGNIFKKQLIYFQDTINSSVEKVKLYHNTLLKIGEASLKNKFLNIPKIRDSISVNQLKKVWNPDISAIVVAAGPSVEDSIESLKNAKGKAVIVAVDRILQYLLAQGVTPDFVVTLDPMKNSINFSNEANVEVPMFCVMQAKPIIMDKQIGRKIVCSSGWYLKEHYEKVEGTFPDVPISGSVATVAVDILYYLGTRKILLVGQDLAFRGDYTHAGGTISNPISSASCLVEGLNGENVKARYDWIEFRNWFQDFIKLHDDVTLIDTKTQGTLIKGTKFMSLEEGIEECANGSASNRNVTNILSQMMALPPVFSEEYFKEIGVKLMDDRKILDKIKQKAKEGAVLCTDLVNFVKQGKPQNRAYEMKLGKIKQITKFIGEQEFYKNLDELVIAYMDSSYVKIFTAKEDEKEEIKKVFDSSRSYFECVVQACRVMDSAIEECMKELEG